MPEFLAPGVFVEEVSFRSPSIAGVDTRTAGFVGPCRYGPVTEAPELLTSLADFERRHGDGQPLAFASATGANYLWHAVRSFFGEGGQRLYVSRVFRPLAGSYPPADLATASPGPAPFADGHARAALGSGHALRLLARYPGAVGNLQVVFTVRLGTPVPALSSLADGDVVWITSAQTPLPAASPAVPPAARGLHELPVYVAHRGAAGAWTFAGGVRPAGAAPQTTAFEPGDFALDLAPGSQALRRVVLDLEVLDANGRALGAWGGLSLNPRPSGPGAPPRVLDQFSLAGTQPVVLLPPADLADGVALLQALCAPAWPAGLDLRLTPAEWAAAAGNELAALKARLEAGVRATARLAGGNDGQLPGAAEYGGSGTGLQPFEAIDDIAIVAAPGATWQAASRAGEVAAITRQLIAHAEKLRYRIAVLDPHEGMSVADVRAFRAGLDSSYAALYYPWVTVADAAAGQRLNLPPSGFVAGIYARTDAERGVFKAPANEVVRGAVGLEAAITAAQQDVLNPEGINVLRFFQGRGYRVWGARTLSRDPAWPYVNLRRYMAYLERAIDKGTQWAVFEPNGEALWARLQGAVQDFLFNEWRAGALLGDTPDKAFFVRCDRTTLTQADLDAGRVVALVGVAPLKPAEFVIFRVGQWTADGRP